jgi:hypothetical protein
MAEAAGANVAAPWEEGFEGFFPKDEGSKKSVREEHTSSVTPSHWEGVFAEGSERGTTTAADGLVGCEVSTARSRDSDRVLIAKLLLVSTLLSAAVKWGSLTVDFPFEPSLGLAFLMIFGPTALNAAKWNRISKEEREAEEKSEMRY